MFFKLHGSLHFFASGSDQAAPVRLKQRPYTKQAGAGLHFSIIPPEWYKAYDRGVFSTLWAKASAAIHKAEHVVIIGYSLPPTDLHSTALFRTSIKNKSLKSLVVVNPSHETRRRTRSVLQRGVTDNTRVLSFEYFPEFLASKRSLWEV
jgi:hypothetical protein